MSTNERERNRSKQRRYRQRHATAIRLDSDLQARDPGKPGRRPTWRVVELCDPRDGLPRWIGITKASEACPWTHLQALTTPAGKWLTELSALGFTPVVSRWLALGAMSRATAERLRSYRLDQIRQWCGGWWPGGLEPPNPPRPVSPP